MYGKYNAFLAFYCLVCFNYMEYCNGFFLKDDE